MYLKNYKTIVIKVGSSLLIDAKKKVRRTWLEKFALDIKDLKNKKKCHNCKFWSYCFRMRKTKNKQKKYKA